jgi:hypothetical protein
MHEILFDRMINSVNNNEYFFLIFMWIFYHMYQWTIFIPTYKRGCMNQLEEEWKPIKIKIKDFVLSSEEKVSVYLALYWIYCIGLCRWLYCIYL